MSLAVLDGIDLTQHERVERRSVARYVREGDLVLEGGGGIGAVTRVLLGAGASVVTYEPGPDPWPALVALAAAYPAGRCTPIQAALAEADGTIPLHVYHPWWATRTVDLGGCCPTATVTAQARDWRAELHARPYTGLVLDIEGAERDILAWQDWPASLCWISAELHGSPEILASILRSVAPCWVLDAIEAHDVYLVAGWRRR